MSKDIDFVWWEGSDLAGFFAHVAKLGTDNVRVRFDMDTHLLAVVPNGKAMRGDDGVQTFNFSHPCPPFCGG